MAVLFGTCQDARSSDSYYSTILRIPRRLQLYPSLGSENSLPRILGHLFLHRRVNQLIQYGLSTPTEDSICGARLVRSAGALDGD